MNPPADRSHLLAPHLRVGIEEIKWHFISDYWGGPISGLAYFQGDLYRFCCFPEDVPNQEVYVLHFLTEEEKVRELAEKARFEAHVGTHWSYDHDGQQLPHVPRCPDQQLRYFEERHKRLQKPPEPKDRPVAVWFKTAEPPEKTL